MTVNWTDASGNYLLDTNSLPIQETKTIPTLSSGTTATTSFNVVRNALDFVETVVLPAGAAGTIRIEAARARAAAAAAAKEAGQIEPITGAGWDIVDVWDELLTQGISGLTLPVLFAGTGSGDTFTSLGQPLYSAVNLSEFIAGISPGDWQKFWINDAFEIINGRAYDRQQTMLPGIYFSFSPIDVDLLAGQDEPLFIMSDLAGTNGPISAVALAQIGLSPAVPEPGSFSLLALGLAFLGFRAGNSRRTWL